MSTLPTTTCFNSRTLGRVRPSPTILIYLFSSCFNSRTLGRVRPSLRAVLTTQQRFQFTPPGKGATSCRPLFACAGCFNSRTLGRVRHQRSRFLHLLGRVSIHAPWEGCDKANEELRDLLEVSIHAPWEGCDLSKVRTSTTKLRFQFTHPGKGATGAPIASE